MTLRYRVPDMKHDPTFSYFQHETQETQFREKRSVVSCITVKYDTVISNNAVMIRNPLLTTGERDMICFRYLLEISVELVYFIYVLYVYISVKRFCPIVQDHSGLIKKSRIQHFYRRPPDIGRSTLTQFCHQILNCRSMRGHRPP